MRRSKVLHQQFVYVCLLVCVCVCAIVCAWLVLPGRVCPLLQDARRQEEREDEDEAQAGAKRKKKENLLWILKANGYTWIWRHNLGGAERREARSECNERVYSWEYTVERRPLVQAFASWDWVNCLLERRRARDEEEEEAGCHLIERMAFIPLHSLPCLT